MITPKLEEYILSGKAFLKTHTHSLGMYGQIILPLDSYAVITKIIWYPFLDPNSKPEATKRVKNVLSDFQEYQLAIRSIKSKNYYVYRNSLDVTLLQSPPEEPVTMETEWENAKRYILLQPKAPIIQDVYLVHETKIDIIISRMIGQKDTENSFTYGLLNNTANQPNSPQGIGDIPVALGDNVYFWPFQILDYQPPNVQNTNLNPTTYYSPEYKQMYAYEDGGEQRSELSNWDGTPFVLATRALCTPLVTFEYVVVQKNVGQKIVGG